MSALFYSGCLDFGLRTAIFEPVAQLLALFMNCRNTAEKVQYLCIRARTRESMHVISKSSASTFDTAHTHLIRSSPVPTSSEDITYRTAIMITGIFSSISKKYIMRP